MRGSFRSGLERHQFVWPPVFGAADVGWGLRIRLLVGRLADASKADSRVRRPSTIWVQRVGLRGRFVARRWPSTSSNPAPSRISMNPTRTICFVLVPVRASRPT